MGESRYSPITWASYYQPDLIHWEGKAHTVGGRYNYRYKNDYPMHGGTAKVRIDGDDVLAVFAKMTARTVSDDSNDGTLLLSLGVDYYPDINASVENGDFETANYLPGAGGSRFIELSSEPRQYYFANIARADKSNVELRNPFYRAGGKHYLTIEEWQQSSSEIGH